jgi:CRISPR-associated protein Csm3
MKARVIVTAALRARSGLRIGGNLPGLAIGGVDLPVIRDPLTGRPYIPGSSLRGKMRALLDRWYGNPPNQRVGNVSIHMPKTPTEYDDSPVGRLFGVLPIANCATMRPTRLLVRDIYLDEAEEQRLRERARGGLLYTEAKVEAAIDRLTSAANPRTIERVLADTAFRPFSASITLYDRDAADVYVPLLLRGMRLLEDDYLGGHGARGSGEIEFYAITVTVRRPADYDFPFSQGTQVASTVRDADRRERDAADLGLFDERLNNDRLLPAIEAAINGTAPVPETTSESEGQADDAAGDSLPA